MKLDSIYSTIWQGYTSVSAHWVPCPENADDESLSESNDELVERFDAFIANDDIVPEEVQRTHFVVQEEPDGAYVSMEILVQDADPDRLLKLYAWLREETLEDVKNDIAYWESQSFDLEEAE